MRTHTDIHVMWCSVMQCAPNCADISCAGLLQDVSSSTRHLAAQQGTPSRDGPWKWVSIIKQRDWTIEHMDSTIKHRELIMKIHETYEYKYQRQRFKQNHDLGKNHWHCPHRKTGNWWNAGNLSATIVVQSHPLWGNHTGIYWDNYHPYHARCLSWMIWPNMGAIIVSCNSCLKGVNLRNTRRTFLSGSTVEHADFL